ncbi:MAG TPA: c-type cytochrome [Pyrinomonadaceae bacterium]|nr:c-type cytochrome [Pyrinomonadaceae bacterium]
MYGTKMILLNASLFTALSVTGPQNENERKLAPKPPSAAAGQETFLKYCASCHGKTAKGDGPAGFVFSTPPSDLTTLSKRHQNKFPAGYVGVVLTFGMPFASHGSEDMPVWGSRFKTLDPIHDPTGQQHIDDVVAYIRLLQLK